MRSFIVAAMVLFFSGVSAQVNFIKYDWDDMLNLAKKENKHLLVYSYTDWGEWCRLMERETLLDPEVVNLMTKKFVNTRLEMEREELGALLNAKYLVNSYPSFLIFDSTGKLVYRIEGYMKAPTFLSELNRSLQKETQLIQPGYSDSLTLDYPQFYLDAFGPEGVRKFPDSAAVMDYLLHQDEDLTYEVHWNIMNRFPYALNSEILSWVGYNSNKFISLYGKNAFWDFTKNVSSVNLKRCIEGQDTACLVETATGATRMLNDEGDYAIVLEVFFYKETLMWPELVTRFNQYLDEYGHYHSGFINEVCVKVYEFCDDPEVINAATEWMRNTVKPNSISLLNTYASLLYKKGDYEEAEKVAFNSMELSIEKGLNPEYAEGLLEKIREQAARK